MKAKRVHTRSSAQHAGMPRKNSSATPLTPRANLPLGTLMPASPLAHVVQSYVTAFGCQQGKYSEGKLGNFWSVDPVHGSGWLSCFALGNDIAFVSASLELNEPANLLYPAVEHCRLGMYRRSITQDHCPLLGDATLSGRFPRILLGQVWNARQATEVLPAHELINFMVVLLMPSALKRLSLRCHCDPLMLSSAIVALDGTRNFIALIDLFVDIEQAKPSAVVAEAYYESKITEALSLIIDHSLTNESLPTVPLNPADRSSLNQARHHIAAHLDHNLTIEELCELTCMSASKLTHLFKQAEQQTPQEYLRNLRMKHACWLLTNTNEPLSKIAKDCGFLRQSSFSEAFKLRFNLTPSEYRKQSRMQ